MNFIYNKENLTTQDQLLVSVADLRDVIQAFTISNEVQRLQELQLILESIVRKNKLPSGALGVELSDLHARAIGRTRRSGPFSTHVINLLD